MPRGRAHLEEHLARADRLSLALISTLEELDGDLELDGTLSAGELEEIGRRLASISAAGLRLLEHDVSAELSAVVTRKRRAPRSALALLAAAAIVGLFMMDGPDADDLPDVSASVILAVPR